MGLNVGNVVMIMEQKAFFLWTFELTYLKIQLLAFLSNSRFLYIDSITYEILGAQIPAGSQLNVLLDETHYLDPFHSVPRFGFTLKQL